jgi:hypothetical protein
MASAALNALAFGSGASGWVVYAAAALGGSIPALLYCLTRMALPCTWTCTSAKPETKPGALWQRSAFGLLTVSIELKARPKCAH